MMINYYAIPTLQGEEHLQKARGFVSRYEKRRPEEALYDLFRGTDLFLASTHYRIALNHGVKDPEEIMKEKEGIEAKLRALEKVTNIEDRAQGINKTPL